MPNNSQQMLDSQINAQVYTDEHIHSLLKFKHAEPPQEIKEYETKLIDDFIQDIIEPLRTKNQLVNTKILWYYNIYKEAKEAKRIKNKSYNGLDEKEVEKLIELLNKKSFKEMVNEFGTNCLVNYFYIIISYHKHNLLQLREKTIYSSDTPIDWIKNTEKNQEELTKMDIYNHPNTKNLLEKLLCIVSLKL